MEYDSGSMIVGCGALAREVRAVLDQLAAPPTAQRWLPANLHNRPDAIPDAVAGALADTPPGMTTLVAYADCGTGGRLDAVLAEYPDATRLPGAHCYEFFAGAEAFAALSEQEPGTFYLTDFLALHFEALVWAGLGLDRHPELRDAYFGNYRRLVWLSQTDDDHTEAAARVAADRLGLAFERHHAGLGALETAVEIVARPRATR